MLKGLVLVPIALAIDALQAIVMLSLMGVSTVAGGILQLVPILGTAVGAVGAGVGYGLAYVIGVGLTLGLGSFFIMLLILSKAFFPRVFFGVAFFELLLPAAPALTVLALRGTYLAHKKEAAQQQTYAQTA